MEEIEAKPRPVISFFVCIVPTLANTTGKRRGFLDKVSVDFSESHNVF